MKAVASRLSKVKLWLEMIKTAVLGESFPEIDQMETFP